MDVREAVSGEPIPYKDRGPPLVFLFFWGERGMGVTASFDNSNLDEWARLSFEGHFEFETSHACGI